MSKKTEDYGKWDSPISYDTVVSGTIVFDDVLVDPITNVIYHIEERPEDNGRRVIVDTIASKDVLPSPYSARTFVQDYGGAAAIVYNGIIYFSNDSGKSTEPDNKIYSLDLNEAGSNPKVITPDHPLWRYANFAVHPQHTNLLVTLREDHDNDPEGKTPGNVVNTICVVDANTSSVNIIIPGTGEAAAGFYATPVFNPSGSKISWQQWDLPDMPWEGGLIYIATVTVDADSGSLEVQEPYTLVAGENGDVSATFPTWISEERLVYISDKDKENRFQNPFIFDTVEGKSTSVLKTPLTEDFAEPAWNLGLYPYAILGGGKYGAFTAFEDGRNILYIIDLDQPSDPTPIESFDYTVAQHVRAATENTFVFTGSKSSAPGGVIRGTVSSSSSPYAVEFEVLKASAPPSGLDEYISIPIPLSLTAEDQRTIYVIYYPPTNPDYTAPVGEKPPCILNVHGGPTALEPQALNWTKMFFTSRGFAWLDVNYRGSSGYGREYIELLNGNWGIYDVADCSEAATILSNPPYSYIDASRIAIRGGSAGGYTTLSSLTFAPNPKFYKTACSAFGGVADPTTLTKIIEKFEMQYMYTLFGCNPNEPPCTWDPRNPIKNIINQDTGEPNFSVPLLMLHGDNDGVVPPLIALSFLTEITEKVPGARLEFVLYADEGHHWHLDDTITDALKHEFTWYERNLL